MGAYYTPVNLDDNTSISPKDFGSGLKLMEHSYLQNDFIQYVLHTIDEGSWKNKPVSWICDYTDDESLKKSYNESLNLTIPDDFYGFKYSLCIILNNTKKEFVDLSEVAYTWIGTRDYIIHPFPLLTNSETDSRGGGDYNIENDIRGSWSGDCFTIVHKIFDVPNDYKNITKDCLFYENLEDLQLVNDSFKRKALKSSTKVDLSTNDCNYKITLTKEESPTRDKLLSTLILNKDSILKFKNTKGELCIKKVSFKSNAKDSTKKVDERYVWFFDTEANRLKRFVFDNFISAEPI